MNVAGKKKKTTLSSAAHIYNIVLACLSLNVAYFPILVELIK